MGTTSFGLFFLKTISLNLHFVLRPSLMPGITKGERATFDKFQGYIVNRFYDMFDSESWASYVVRTIVQKPMVLYAALTFYVRRHIQWQWIGLPIVW